MDVFCSRTASFYQLVPAPVALHNYAHNHPQLSKSIPRRAGSAVAFGKLHGVMPSKPLNLPQKNEINMGLAAGSAGAGLVFLATGSPALGVAALTTTTATGGALGYHLTASIGGADMPVVITLLNSYSGYALCAEGFMMNNDLLVTVGALIGSSGALRALAAWHAVRNARLHGLLQFGSVVTCCCGCRARSLASTMQC